MQFIQRAYNYIYKNKCVVLSIIKWLTYTHSAQKNRKIYLLNFRAWYCKENSGKTQGNLNVSILNYWGGLQIYCEDNDFFCLAIFFEKYFWPNPSQIIGIILSLCTVVKLADCLLIILFMTFFIYFFLSKTNTDRLHTVRHSF